MQFDLSNKVVKLCADCMSAEAQGETDVAKKCFQEAWALAETNFERFTAAHYMARNQGNATAELQWNIDALKYAEAMGDDEVKSHFPSLTLI